MRKAFELKHVVPRSFMIGGLTAKWGIGENRDDRYKNPLHAWTISGRADGSTDFSPLLDRMGTGKALTLSGFDGTPGSGFEDGYLVFDGVDDVAISSSFTTVRGYTMIGNWEFTKEVTNDAGFVKPNDIRIYNRVAGASVAINSGSNFISFPEVRSFKAICSDGRLYDSDWQMYTHTGVQLDAGRNTGLFIGRNSGKHTSMRFKNLAIYEGAPLSEEQCKKAYDWLQTL